MRDEHCSAGRRWWENSKAWIFESSWKDHEEIAWLKAKLAEANERRSATVAMAEQLQAELERWKTVTDYARGNGVEGSGPGDLQALIERLRGERAEARRFAHECIVWVDGRGHTAGCTCNGQECLRRAAALEAKDGTLR